jgi:hypothetical protein
MTVPLKQSPVLRKLTMSKRSRVGHHLANAWQEIIKSEYCRGHINSERSLQGHLFAELRQRMREDGETMRLPARAQSRGLYAIPTLCASRMDMKRAKIDDSRVGARHWPTSIHVVARQNGTRFRLRPPPHGLYEGGGSFSGSASGDGPNPETLRICSDWRATSRY